ncbi:hypothetical protein DQG23_24990 [Paenibacillus contaminans]|uniref:Uncharacterized protein n=1 Tax=Paenibacillus contaminans TaxID=450362 RepID=A0A329MF17_9BACL|nr:hypothetical protein DQG23_24990 [Paenibacillus contaminans]
MVPPLFAKRLREWPHRFLQTWKGNGLLPPAPNGETAKIAESFSVETLECSASIKPPDPTNNRLSVDNSDAWFLHCRFLLSFFIIYHAGFEHVNRRMINCHKVVFNAEWQGSGRQAERVAFLLSGMLIFCK